MIWVLPTSAVGNPVTTARLELAPAGGSMSATNIAIGPTYQTMTGTVTVTSGSLDVGLYLDAGANVSMQIDDVRLTKP